MPSVIRWCARAEADRYNCIYYVISLIGLALALIGALAARAMTRASAIANRHLIDIQLLRRELRHQLDHCPEVLVVERSIARPSPVSVVATGPPREQRRLAGGTSSCAAGGGGGRGRGARGGPERA
jgi:hypothetical protein